MDEKHPEYVIACYTRMRWNMSQEILLVLKNRPATQAGRLNLIGGKIEDGETPEQAAIREMKEEAGYDVRGPAKVVGTMQDRHLKIYCVNAFSQSDNAPPKPREGETESVEWMFVHSLLKDKRLIPNLRVIIPLILMGVEGFHIDDNIASINRPMHDFKITVPTYMEASLG